jgi:ABC-type branched-subunit amino acid transport system substrate-binding protein
MKSIYRMGVLALAASAVALPAPAQDAYTIGVSGALTGPGAGTYAPVIEAMRIYIDELNAKGGVNGRKINLVVQDDQANPQKAAAEAKKLITQDNVLMLINVSLSSTYAPILAEAGRAGVPVYFGGSVCTTETYPKADKLQFCTTAFGARYDSRYGLAFVKEVAKAPVKLGLVAMAIPVSRNEIDWAEGHAKEVGIEPVAKDAVPPPTVDYGPVATKMKDAGATVVYPWAPWITIVRTFESLRKIGWDGTYVAFAHINAEDELARLKDDKLFVYGANAFFSENLPVHQEIRAAAAKAGARSPVTQLAEGWIVGMTIEAIVKKVSWPPTREKVAAAMNALEVDTKGLRGAPIVWTADNHFRTKQCYKAYKWDSAKGAVATVKDWVCLDVK